MYSTYGQRTVTAGEGNASLGYCARDGVLTEKTGLLYMRARYDSPELMRFINEDIIVGDISNSNSLNRYAYVEGNPVTMVDPFGLEAVAAIKNDIFKVAKGSQLLASNMGPLTRIYAAIIMSEGSDNLPFDVLAALDVEMTPKRKAIIRDVRSIIAGIASGGLSLEFEVGFSLIGAGFGGLELGNIVEDGYKVFTGEDSEKAFLIGDAIGNIVGGSLGYNVGEGIAREIEGTAKAALEGGLNSANTLTDAQKSRLNALNNTINDHLTESDFSGTLRDLQGNPVPNGKGGFFDHMGEMKDSYNALNKIKNGLEGSLKNPNLSNIDRQILQDGLNQANSYLIRIEELFAPYGGIK